MRTAETVRSTTTGAPPTSHASSSAWPHRLGRAIPIGLMWCRHTRRVRATVRSRITHAQMRRTKLRRMRQHTSRSHVASDASARQRRKGTVAGGVASVDADVRPFVEQGALKRSPLPLVAGDGRIPVWATPNSVQRSPRETAVPGAVVGEYAFDVDAVVANQRSARRKNRVQLGVIVGRF